MKNEIIKLLKSLENINGVCVTEKESSVQVKHDKEHALDFKFLWSKDHFIGYFIDKHDTASQAVLSLRNEPDAKDFKRAYSILVKLRARQKTT